MRENERVKKNIQESGSERDFIKSVTLVFFYILFLIKFQNKDNFFQNHFS